MASNLDPVANYFAPHSQFGYDATANTMEEFKRLAATSGWSRKGPDYRRERGRFIVAFVAGVNARYGENSRDLAAWQALCGVCGIDPMLPSITKCRKVCRVNLSPAGPALRE